MEDKSHLSASEVHEGFLFNLNDRLIALAKAFCRILVPRDLSSIIKRSSEMFETVSNDKAALLAFQEALAVIFLPRFRQFMKGFGSLRYILFLSCI